MCYKNSKQMQEQQCNIDVVVNANIILRKMAIGYILR
jgi:predicted nucleic acid-binding protein